jgi:hypothetical protein
MSTSPAATPVTIPALTVATAVLDDSHVASAVTTRLEVSESAAVAVNCDEAPAAGAAPLTVSAATLPETGGGGEDVVDEVDDEVADVDEGAV